ncbi:restriction endonuclease subunit S [Lactobacillus amylovorus]|uniref:restriction endonuclease subunit S n=1 Tax=Lactobacillus amylovorus TaxID=1604 RepID=UPI00232F140A|nr:restriction endonuclease subunit S [Lactobacillus amylovorus]MDB6256062.1 restriction endonuclease subunit S [Lactobacillus amylovorus]
MSNKEQRKAPVLRFKGFTDDWEQRKLGDIANVYDGTHTTPDYQKNGIMFLSVENIDTLTSKKFITKSDYLENYKHKPEYHDIFMTRIGSIGKTNILETHDPRAFYVSLALIKPKDIDPYYLKYWLSSNTTQKEIWRRTLQIAFPQKINKDEISKVQSSISKSKNEQYNIGQLLNKIDHLLLLQQRKLDELIQIKEGIGQGLLNRHYRNLSIRFNQENSSWKQTKLGKIASFVNGRAFKQKELMNRGLYPVLRVGNFYTNNKWYYSNLNLSPDKYANKGDLLYTWSASFGPHVWKGPKVIYHYHIWKINFDPAVISKAYLYEFLKLDKKEILANSNGSTMIHITKKDMENKMITVPDMNEQIKIGKILEKLDLKIELNKNKLNNLKSVKQFLLQKMFM